MMEARGLRQRAVAEALGVSEPTVSKWTNRAADIPTRHIGPLAELLGVTGEAVLAVAVASEAAA